MLVVNAGRKLLKTLSLGVETDERIENRQNVAPVLGDALESDSLFWLAHALSVPFGQHSGWNLNVSSQLLCRVAAEKQAIKECRLSLREFKFAERVL
jgi:hypothetical protein